MPRMLGSTIEIGALSISITAPRAEAELRQEMPHPPGKLRLVVPQSWQEFYPFDPEQVQL